MSEFRSAVYSWQLPKDKNPRLGEKLRRRREKIQRSLFRHTSNARKSLLERMAIIDKKLWQLTNHEPEEFCRNRLGGNPLLCAEQNMEHVPPDLPVFTYPIDRISPTYNRMSERNIQRARDLVAEEYKRRLLCKADDQFVWEHRGQDFEESHEFQSFFLES